jgi:hypothetical protein
MDENQEPWYVDFDDVWNCWAIGNENWDRMWVAHGLTKDAAEYGLTILRNDYIELDQPHVNVRADVYDALERRECARCEHHFYDAQMQEGVCPTCRS